MTASIRTRVRTISVGLALPVVLAGCSPSPPAAETTTAERLTATVVGTRPHDPSAFTQGLEVDDGELYEGTGRNGSSYVRVSRLDTGEEVRRADLADDYFGEGLTTVDDTVWQITWQDGVAFARDADTLQEKRSVSYEGEGWGLCGRENGLVMSDGSSTLTFRDSESFDTTGSVEVTLDGAPLGSLNELECAEDGSVYANVWQTFLIARIDPQTGVVTAMVDAEPLWNTLTASEREDADVLNGIAQIPGTDRFLVTGKLWPTMFEVEFTPSQ